MRSSGFRLPRFFFATFVAVLGAALFASLAFAEAPRLPRRVRVTETYDGKAFSYRVNSIVPMSGFSVHHLTYPSPVVSELPQNNTIPAELYLPDGYEAWQSPRPAVICMHILDGNFQLVRMTCSMLASHGIPALMFKLPYYGERSPGEGTRNLARQPARFAAALAQARTEIRRTVDLLAARPEIDGKHLGITGISLGAIVAATGAAEEPRLGRAMLVLGGGDLLEIIHHADETSQLSATIRSLPPAERDKVEGALREVDPLTHAEKLRDRAERGRVVMVNAGADEVVPRRCTERLAAALGIEDEVVWLDGLGHYTTMAAMPQTLRRTVQFFGEDLPGDVRVTMKKRSQTSVQIALELIQRAATIIGEPPKEGCCHLADVEVSVSDETGDEVFAAEVLLARDGKGRFKLDARTEPVGRIALGGGSPLWLLAEGTLFRGSEEEDAKAEPRNLVSEKDLITIRTVAGALQAATMAPGIFEQMFAVEEETKEDGRRILNVARRDGGAERLRILLDDDRRTAREIHLKWRDGRAAVRLRAFQANAPSHDGLFRPAAADRVEEVSGGDLQRMFQAISDFAVHRLRQ